jgi:hypothetical protein
MVRRYAAKFVCNFSFETLYTLLAVIIIKYFLFIVVDLLYLEILTEITKYHAHTKNLGSLMCIYEKFYCHEDLDKISSQTHTCIRTMRHGA